MAGNESNPPPVRPAGASTAPWSRRRWLAGSAAAALSVATGCRKFPDIYIPFRKLRRGELKIFTWDGYISKAVIEDFERKTGWEIDPDFPTYDSNQKLMEVLEAGTAEYDLVMPSAFLAETLAARKLLRRIDISKVSGLPLSTGAMYNPPFDPRNEIIVPYIWGSTGIGYDSDRVAGLPKSWEALFYLPPPPRMPNELMGFRPIEGITVLDDARFTIGSALISMGISPNTRDKASVDRVVEILKQAPIERFDTDNIALNLRSGAAGISMAWSGDVTKATQDLYLRDGEVLASGVAVKPGDIRLPGNKQVRLALPSEGSIVFRDSLAIPSCSTNVEGAHAFIDYLLQPRVAAEVTNYSYYATTVEKATAYVKRFIFNGPSYFIHPAGKNKWLENLGADEAIYVDGWLELKKHWNEQRTAEPEADQGEVSSPGAEVVPGIIAPEV